MSMEDVRNALGFIDKNKLDSIMNIGFTVTAKSTMELGQEMHYVLRATAETGDWTESAPKRTPEEAVNALFQKAVELYNIINRRSR